MVMRRKMKREGGHRPPLPDCSKSPLLAWPPTARSAGRSAGWEEPLGGKVPQDESAEGTWLQDCFCAGLKSYHCRVKLVKGSTYMGQGEGRRAGGKFMLRQPFLEGANQAYHLLWNKPS